jgi:hypothetical protein
MEIVYLCGPINGRSDDECKTWREQAKVGLVNFRDPMVRDYRGRELEPGIAAVIVESDKKDIGECTMLLVYYEAPSVGTSMEILFAFERGMKIILVNRTENKLSPWLTYHVTRIVKTLDEALTWINDQENFSS